MSYAATYDPPDPNEWVRPVAVTVTVLLIVWNVAGWIMEKPNLEGAFLAALTASFQALSFNASAQLRRASSRVQSASVARAKRFWRWTLITCSLWAAGSAHHAYGVIVAREVAWAFDLESLWTILQAAPLLVVLTVAAFIEPFLPWAIETVEAAPKAPQQDVQTPPAPPVETEPGRASRQASRRVARELSRQAPRGASKRSRNSAETRAATRAPPLSEHELRQAVEELTRQGKVVSIRKVAEHLDVPPSRVERSPARARVMAA